MKVVADGVDGPHVVRNEHTVSSGSDFADWVAPHLGVLSAMAIRQVGRADADDLVQEVLLRAWRGLATYDASRGSVRAWLAGILFRATPRRPRDVVLDTTTAAALSGVPELTEELDLAIASLPRRQLQVVTLHYLADLPVDEIAQALGISVGSVKSHLFDARANLRKALNRS